MSAKYRLNLASQPFRPYRATNLVLALVLALVLGFTAWQVLAYRGYRKESPDLRALEAARSAVGETGRGIQQLNVRLSQPEAQARLKELQYLSQVIERKRFSWTRMLQVMEEVIPDNVYLVALQPEIGEDGSVYLQMEARGQAMADLTRFIADLEGTPDFWDVSVSVDERGTVQGRQEIRVVMGANYAQEEQAEEESVAEAPAEKPEPPVERP